MVLKRQYSSQCNYVENVHSLGFGCSVERFNKNKDKDFKVCEPSN